MIIYKITYKNVFIIYYWNKPAEYDVYHTYLSYLMNLHVHVTLSSICSIKIDKICQRMNTHLFSLNSVCVLAKL